MPRSPTNGYSTNGITSNPRRPFFVPAVPFGFENVNGQTFTIPAESLATG
ncbi:MAG TPA: hypothetical protein VEU96_20890 [Bryobacteraceae bacterium]|nr:hypothetical protein [Bryobacteraceae bacterium]